MAGYVERGVRHLPDGREIDLTEAAWQRRRKALHEREDSKCEKCSRFTPLHNSEIAWAGHAHHKHGRKGGDDRIQNLKWCCNFCHFIEHQSLKVIARKEPAT